MDVTCRICKSKIDRDIAFKVKKGKTNLYYCSQKEYNDDVRQKEEIKTNKDKLQIIIDDIFESPVTNSILYKEISEWDKLKPIEIIIDYLQENKNFINKSLNKDFQSEYAKIRYFSAIVKNNIKNYNIKKVEVIKKIDVEIYETEYQSKKRKKCLSEYIQEDGD